jgi:hypothetical protein
MTDLAQHWRARSSRRQNLVARLHAAGQRPVLEALLEVAEGRPLDDVLEDFARIPPGIYHAIGADILPIDTIGLVEGGRQ